MKVGIADKYEHNLDHKKHVNRIVSDPTPFKRNSEVANMQIL